MVRRFDTVALRRGIPDRGLAEGAVGQVIHVYTGDVVFEVEFAIEGRPATVLTLTSTDVCPLAEV